MPAGGPDTVTVPGVVAGWAALADFGARLDLARILAPAIELARGGVAVSSGLARATRARLDVVRADPGLSALVLDARAEPLPEGTLICQPALARTLTTVAADWRSFYSGELAGRLVDALVGFGSSLSRSDFADHRAESPPPLQLSVDGVTWSAAPPPSQGAAFLAVLDSAALGLDLGASVLDPGQRVAAVLAAAHSAELRRDVLLGDPRSGPIDVAALLGSADGSARPSVHTLPTGPKPAGDTVAVTVVADDGSAVSLIQSVFQSFGSGLLDPDTGVVFHNRGSAFSLDPTHPGRVRPGARPPHTLCPVLGVGRNTVLALGCQGGRAQPWILSQVAGDAIDVPNLTALLARPRWVIGSRELGRSRPTLMLEPGTPEADVLISSARAFGMEVVETLGFHDDAGHVQVARFGPGGLDAASDPRADGESIVVPTPGGSS